MLVTTAIRALYDEDVLDIMTYLGLQQAPMRNTHYSYGCEEPHELAAAFVGHGFGLCDTYWNATACSIQEEEMAYQQLVSISFSRTGIAFSQAGMWDAYIRDGYDDRLSDSIGFAGFGSDDWRYGDREGYWNAVKKHLNCKFQPNSRHNISKVFIFDESAEGTIEGQRLGEEMEAFVRTLMEDRQHRPYDVQVFRNESLYVTAIGAARLALRGTYAHQEQGLTLTDKHELRKRAPNPLYCPWTAWDLADDSYC